MVTESDQQDDVDQHDQHEEVMQQDSSDQTNYCCPEPSCKRTSVRSYNLDRHLAISNHVYDDEKHSGLDMATKIYFERSESLKTYQGNCMMLQGLKQIVIGLV